MSAIELTLKIEEVPYFWHLTKLAYHQARLENLNQTDYDMRATGETIPDSISTRITYEEGIIRTHQELMTIYMN